MVEPFGNIKKTPKGPKVEEERSPWLMFLTRKRNRICAEMPGVNEADIKLSLNGDILGIQAATGDRKYRRKSCCRRKRQPDFPSSYKNFGSETKKC